MNKEEIQKVCEKQPFEKHIELTESILYAANNWKINRG